ncbi:MAG: hypothetical protein ACI9KE_003995 [Polyangiales bacterium]|jgi:hypothetical protein
MRRLSRTQLDNTVGDIITALAPSEASAVLTELSSAVGGVPTDQRAEASQAGQLLFFRSDQAVGRSAVTAHYQIGLAAGAALSTPERLNAMGFDCATNGDSADDAECVDRLVRRIGALTHRRPLMDDEFAFFRRETYAGDSVDQVDLADLIAKLFVQAHFVFHVEGVGALNAYETANRLSYHLWDTMPDEALFEAAASGRLLTDEGWQEEIQRMTADVRVENMVRSLLLEWLRFDQLNMPSSGNGADFDAITEGLELDAGFDDAVEAEIVDLFLHTLRSGGSFEDFFLSDVTTTTHPVLASIYGVEPASEGGTVALGPERRGLLTRVGALLSRAEVALPAINSITHPILRGVFVRRQIVCDNLPAAPGGAMDNLPTVDRSVTGSREATDILTGTTACSGCHARINPAGYALESFDAIGRLRTDEPLFDQDGAETMRLPIDDGATLPEAPEGINGGAALSQALYDSEKVGACFARHYVRFTLGRSERITEDGCALRAVDEAIDEGRPLREVMTEPLLSPSFRQRAEPGLPGVDR